MSTNNQEQEIDLGKLFNSIGTFFNSFVNTIFDFIFFLRKKIIIILALLIIGIVSAYLLDGKKRYEHELSVIPNFGSNEYLYKRIDEINTKLREKDPDFFKKLGIEDYKNILSIEVEAYPGIFGFINGGEEDNNFKMIELMAEDGDMDKILSSDLTTRNFFHHKISIKTKGMWSREKLIDPILNYLNNNEYFSKLKTIHLVNIEDKLAKNDSLTKQIDNIIFQLSTSSKSNGTISISEASDISELVKKKDELTYDSQKLKTDYLIYDKIIKEQSSIINIRDYDILLLNSKVLFPILLVLFYLLSFPVIRIFTKHKLRNEFNKNKTV